MEDLLAMKDTARSADHLRKHQVQIGLSIRV